MTNTKLTTHKVVQHNDLIKGVAKMDKVPLKIFELCVSAIDTENPPQDNTIYLSKKEVFEFFNVLSKNKHTRFKEAIEKLQKQSFFQIKQQENDSTKEEYLSIVPIPFVKWNNYNDIITVQFSDKVIPYLINLKSNFTQYLIADIGKLNSKYSIILYKWLTMNYNQYEKYGNTIHKNPYLSIDELREITDTKKDYLIMSNFTKEVLEKPLNEINRNTHYTITYEKKKAGKRIAGIQFHVEAKESPVKYEKTYIGSSNVATQNQNNLEVLPLAYQDKYINLLVKLGIVEMSAVQDICNIYIEVVPLYEEIDRKWLNTLSRTETIITKHLHHIQSHMIANSTPRHDNITKYLKTAVKGFKHRLEQYQVEGVERVEEERQTTMDDYL